MVRNFDDMLLIPSGTPLTERHIQILQAWGVAEIEVQAAGAAEVSGDPLAALAPEALAKMSKELESIFWEPDHSNPLFATIFKLMLRRLASRTSGGQTD